jgi:hypothetical protein
MTVPSAQQLNPGVTRSLTSMAKGGGVLDSALEKEWAQGTFLIQLAAHGRSFVFVSGLEGGNIM